MRLAQRAKLGQMKKRGISFRNITMVVPMFENPPTTEPNSGDQSSSSSEGLIDRSYVQDSPRQKGIKQYL